MPYEGYIYIQGRCFMKFIIKYRSLVIETTSGTLKLISLPLFTGLV